MDNNASGSFIPKRSTGKVASRRIGKRIYIFSYIAYALFFGTLLSVVGIFLLNQQAQTELEAKITQLAEESEQFDRDDMRSVTALSTQLNTAESILNDHLAPSLLFDELEDVIVETVQLSGLTYTRSDTGVNVTFMGSADTFDTLLFQRKVMSESEVFSAAKVSNVTYGSETIEAVGASARNRIAPTETEAKISFTFDDDAIRQKIGYEPRSNGEEDDETLNEQSLEDEISVATSTTTQ